MQANGTTTPKPDSLDSRPHSGRYSVFRLARTVHFGFSLTIVAMLSLSGISITAMRSVVTTNFELVADQANDVIQLQELRYLSARLLANEPRVDSQEIPEGFQQSHDLFVRRAVRLEKEIESALGRSHLQAVLRRENDYFRIFTRTGRADPGGVERRRRSVRREFEHSLEQFHHHELQQFVDGQRASERKRESSEQLVFMTVMLSLAACICVAIFARRSLKEIGRSERQRAEAATLERVARSERDREQAKLNSVFMNAPAAIAIQTGPDHRFEMVNSLYQKFLGERQVVGLTFAEVFPEEIDNDLAETRDRVFQTGEAALHKELGYRAKNAPESSTRYFDIAYLPLRDEEDGIYGIVAYAQDVTEKVIARKKIELLAEDYRVALQKAHEAENRLRNLLNSLPIVLWAMNLQRQFTFYEGKGLESLEHVGALQSPGLTLDVVPHDSTIRGHIERALAGEAVTGIDEFGGRWFESRYSPTRNEKDEITGIVGISFDITEQTRVKAELQNSRVVAQANAEASRLKSEFLANMSHEIRTPLNAVIGMTELLLDTELDDQQRKWTRMVQESGSGLLTILNDLLDFSKIEAGKLDLEKTDFILTSVVEGQAELLTTKARENGLSVMTYIDPELPTALRGDAGRIGQILLNLLGNAVKFTSRGSVTLRALSDGKQDQIQWVRFEVHDTGIGISDDEKVRLFRPFSQADQSTARRFGGTGLGLSICKRLVDLMKGSIGVESVSGKGSVFWFRIPLELSKATARPRFEPFDRTLPNHRLRILVADADPIAREILTAYLTKWKIEAVVTATSHEAVQASKNDGPFDLILIDESMDSVGQKPLTKALQAVAHTPQVLMTGFERIHRKRLSAGFQGFLSKPIRQSDLFDQIVELVVPKSKATLQREELSSSPVIPVADSNARILVVEDNSVNQLLTITLLKRLGYSAQAVGNGREAVDAYLSGAYDLILMDCQMPEMDGYEATRRIRDHEKRSGGHTPIIALTANAMKEDEVRCLASGMDSFASKPLKKNQLASIVAYWLKHSRGTLKAG